ncbi:MAG: hypothetical protein PHC64_02170 [Candidatus Gastranaerophilales bacterium]|nr:hypothetical protein [Candidatus Gastranaerophilales bacterium]
MGFTNLTTKKKLFSIWCNRCKNSIIEVNAHGNNIYNPDIEIEDFEFVGQEYRSAIAAGDYNRAKKLYTEAVLVAAKNDITHLDINGDEKLEPTDVNTVMQFFIMDLDKDGYIDENEYAAYLYAIDANNKDKVAKGRITREEYLKTAKLENQKKLTNESATFKGQIISCYKGLFGYDPRPSE